MASNIGDQLRKIAERNKQKLGEVVKEAVRDLAGQMIDNSPVKSGGFKGNWKGSVGEIDRDASAPPDESGEASKASVEAALEAWKPGETLYVTNSKPYAQRIEHGWSEAAPTGVVGATMAGAEAAMKRAVAKVNNGG
ncbi:MAG: HK97 gp10 family phage protein [Burkholderiaceae bacterium]|jgi:hypothetical protein|nr:HK97 gp10 family phage protein [Burkholderiaceae bacterium]